MRVAWFILLVAVAAATQVMPVPSYIAFALGAVFVGLLAHHERRVREEQLERRERLRQARD